MRLSLTLVASLLALSSHISTAFHLSSYAPPYTPKCLSRPIGKSLGASASPNTVQDAEAVATAQGVATNALLFSSWTDGVAANKDAAAFLKYSILRKMLNDKSTVHEDEVKSSAEFSPCNGPDINALNNLEVADELIIKGNNLLDNDGIICDEDAFNSWSGEVLSYLLSQTHDVLDLKFLYIPTAMYALNPQSSNTPGKQRQRARADGKKRRDQVAKFLEGLFNYNSPVINVCCITLDLDDGSLKQSVGFNNEDAIPKNDKAAISEWNPHLIYVEGGNTFWLQHCIEKGDYSKLIKTACTGPKGSIYCGKSAGAIVAGDRIDTATWKGWDNPSVVPERETYDKWIGCPGFGFVGKQSFFPHYSNDWEDLVKEKLSSGPMKGNTEMLHEDAVCCTLGDKTVVFGTRFRS